MDMFPAFYSPKLSRPHNIKFKEAIKKELGSLKQSGCSEEIEKRHLPTVPNILTSRFVYTLKQIGSSNEKAKARLVAQGHTDIDKPYIFHDSISMKQPSLRIIITFACVNGYPLWFQDVDQAYIQSDTPFQRAIYIVPPRQLGYDRTISWKLLKPL